LERRPVLASGIVAASLIAIAFGALPASLLVRIPLIRNIHHMHDTFLTAALPLMLVVAVHGADVLRRSGARHVTFIAVITGIVSWWLYTNVGKYLRPDGFAPGAVLLMAPVAVAIPWCFYARQLNPGRVLPRIALAGALVAVLAPGGLHLESGIPRVDELLMQPRFRAALSQDSPAVEAVRRMTTVEPMRAAGINWTLVEGSHPFYGLEGIGGADPMEVPVYRSLVDATGIWRSLWLTIVRNGDVGRLSPLLDMLNVGFLVGRYDIPLPDQVVEIPVGGPDRLRVGRRPSAWPRAFFVDGVTTYTDVADLLNQVAAAGNPFAAVQVGDSEAIGATRAMLIPSGNTLAATRYKLTANTTTFTIRAPRAGVAVLSEAFLPDDFQATLNGSRVPYFRVNQAFKGVTIPSGGDWIVKFEYRPAHWELSLGLAGLGVMLLSGLGVAAMAPRGAVETKLMESPAVPVSS
jgi:hypothetical protein